MVLYYCDKCGYRVSLEEVEAGAARRLDADRVLCAACAAKEPKPGASGKAAAAVGKSTAAAKAVRASGSVPLPPLPREARTGKTSALPRVPQERERAHAVQAPGKPSARTQTGPDVRLFIAGGGVVLVLIAAGLVFSGRRTQPDSAADDQRQDARADDGPKTAVTPTPQPKAIEQTAGNTPAPGGKEDSQQRQRKAEDAIGDIRTEIAASKLEQAKALQRDCPEAVYAYYDKLQDVATTYRSTPAGQEAVKLLAAVKLPAADESGWDQAVNLLPLVDPSKDTVNGKWQMQNGVLRVEQAGMARLEIPYTPPEEYDFRTTFTRESGEEDVNMMLVGGGKAFMWSMGCEKNKCDGFETIDDKTATLGVSAVRISPAVTNNTEHTAVVQVRKRLVRAFLDGKVIREFPTDYHNFGMRKDWKLRSDTVLGLGAHQGTTSYGKIEIREVTGKGRATR